MAKGARVPVACIGVMGTLGVSRDMHSICTLLI